MWCWSTLTGGQSLSFRYLGWSLGSTHALGNLGDVVSPSVPHLMLVLTPVSAQGVFIWLVPHHLLSQFSNITCIVYTYNSHLIMVDIGIPS